ncbi:MAG TPA: c-type cytochrome [Thermoanaerobaculia bacterium]|nr:c-type cytochrome [Thermoanaerobaculia bacterium]
MKVNLMFSGIVCSIALAVACATTTTAAPDTGTSTAGQATATAPMSQTQAQGEFKNLQILPRNITRPELIPIMRGFSRSLGVKCTHCHVRLEGQAPDAMDFAADEKNEKKVARVMLRMTRTINSEYLAKVNEHNSEVTCWTCHRNQVTPPTYAIEKTPLPPGQEPAPPGPPPATPPPAHP